MLENRDGPRESTRFVVCRHQLGAWELQTQQLKSLYDLGTLDFVSVRWGPMRNTLRWRRVLSDEELAFYLPLFISGALTREVLAARKTANELFSI
jgi:hypothetical protein